MDGFVNHIDFTNIPKSEPIKPYIECDGGYYAVCYRCWCELEPTDEMCPNCKQKQDWSWFGKNKK